MHFQIIFELQEITDVTKVAWKRVPNCRARKLEWADFRLIQEILTNAPGGGGLLKYDLGRDVLLRLEK